MRVFERGVGETMSCGTGACAVAVAAAAETEHSRPVAMSVESPGGVLEVVWTAGGPLELTGPAVLVAAGELWWPGGRWITG